MVPGYKQTKNFKLFLGLDTQIQEIKESVELPLTHPEYYEEMGIKPPKVWQTTESFEDFLKTTKNRLLHVSTYLKRVESIYWLYGITVGMEYGTCSFKFWKT